MVFWHFGNLAVPVLLVQELYGLYTILVITPKFPYSCTQVVAVPAGRGGDAGPVGAVGLHGLGHARPRRHLEQGPDRQAGGLRLHLQGGKQLQVKAI